MFCSHCGTENPDYAAFCPNCGRRLEKETHTPPADIIPIPGERMGNRQVPAEQVTVMRESFPAGRGIVPPAPFPTSPPSSPLASISSPGEYPPMVVFGTASPRGQQSFKDQPNLWKQPSVPASGSPSQQAPFSGRFGPLSDQQSFLSGGTLPTVPTTPIPVPRQASTSGAGWVSPPTPPITRGTWLNMLAQPLSIWASIIGIAAIVLILVVLQLTGTDWAAGALQLAIGAAIMAFLLALATGVRALVGRRMIGEFIRVGIVVTILLTLCLMGFTQQSSIHRWQGSVLEGQQQWQRAISEYQLAGESAPTSDNIASAYTGWGEQLSAAQHYEDAIAKFDTVLNNYGSATREVPRAQSGNIQAYLAWGRQAMQQHDYIAATKHFDDLLNLSYCSSNCQTQAKALDAAAYYSLAEMKLAAQQYAEASSAFQVILTRFSDSPEAQKLHGEYAKSLWGQGQQQLTNSCSSAIPTYQTLSTQFADTPEGQQAAQALHAPQPVTGHFIGSIPNDPSLTLVVFLAKDLNGGMSSDQLYQALTAALTQTIHNDGTFSFTSVPQGTYDLAWGTNRNNGAYHYRLVYHSSDKTPVYVATVGTLCPFDFGDINEPIPVP